MTCAWGVEVTQGLTDALDQLFDAVSGIGDHLRVRRPNWDGRPPALTDADRAHVVDQLRSEAPPRMGRRRGFPLPDYCDALERFARDVDATAVFTVLHCFDWMFYGRGTTQFTVPAVAAFDACFAASGRPALAELAARLEDVGRGGAPSVWDEYRRGFARRWPAGAVSPFVASTLDIVVDALTADAPYGVDPTAPYRALSTLPELPDTAVDALFEVAIGRAARRRQLAQATLARAPGVLPRVLAALTDGKADVRAVAARWLGQIGDHAAVPALEEALRTERIDAVKGAVFDGLSALGEPLNRYLDPATLDAEAERGLRGGVPKSLNWLNLDLLPKIRWSDGSPVTSTTVVWLLSVAVKNKTPEPDAMVRHYCSLLRADDRGMLASFVVTSWTSAKAIGAKGVLALVAACGGDDAVAVAHDFLYRHYGTRAAECRALLAMLAWTDSPAAAQTLLAVATRFRTKGLREEAENQVAALAERRGWTPEELADRTAADGGFDAGGVLRLDFQPGNTARTFTATIQPDLTIVLRAPDRKVIKTLPAPRQSDDKQAAAAAKKALAAARKLVKTGAGVHTERLYAAMCSQRTWRFADWATYVQRHPVVGQLAIRLVWVADGTTFRPLDDGTLTDTDDEEVRLDEDQSVLLAHSLTVGADEPALWRSHFVDYEVVPLFDQFRAPYVLPAEDVRATSIPAPPARMPYFTFRTVASKLGYTIGTAVDGPQVYDYRKSLPTIGRTVSMRFSGIDVTQPNDPVTLEELRFDPSDALADVPPVLLSEAYADLHQIAAAGDAVGATRQTG